MVLCTCHLGAATKMAHKLAKIEAVIQMQSLNASPTCSEEERVQLALYIICHSCQWE